MLRIGFIFSLFLYAILCDKQACILGSKNVFSEQENAGEGCGCSMKPRKSHVPESPHQRSLSITANSPIINEIMAFIPGGSSYMGSDKPIIIRDGEGPRRKVSLSPFYIDRFEVSNQDFHEFVQDTGFVTQNEMFGWSFVFHTAIPDHIMQNIQQAVLGAEWWLPVNGSTWLEPEGPGSNVFATNRSEHPVVQVTWNDAAKYCEWRNARLPTEAEWEAAASGSVKRTKKKVSLFPWGNDLVPNNTHRMNIFQGSFPTQNTKEDGYEYTAPIWEYGEQNDYGLYNMLGNVWEWVQDWWTIDHAFNRLPKPGRTVQDPSGPQEGREKVKKGGSFLCHYSYCYRYRLGSRFQSTPDSAASNIGFRCARTASPEKIESQITGEL